MHHLTRSVLTGFYTWNVHIFWSDKTAGPRLIILKSITKIIVHFWLFQVDLPISTGSPFLIYSWLRASFVIFLSYLCSIFVFSLQFACFFLPFFLSLCGKCIPFLLILPTYQLNNVYKTYVQTVGLHSCLCFYMFY